jgi:hypothetical protein
MSQSNSNTRAHWVAHIAAQETSGQSQKVYCTAHDLNIHSLSYWRKILKDEKPASGSKVRFKSVKLTNDDTSQSAEYKVLLPSQASLILSGDFDLNKAHGLIEILATRQC